ncbi:MAG: hypothetical protein GY803_07095 [Chloroflexi bacterium]|nr:hypothetical protein [Chloroflexota bacterium]
MHTNRESGKRYHLFDGKGKLALVADHGSSWMPEETRQTVRFVNLGAQVLATLDFPGGGGKLRNGRFHTNHALILDHAVYAIINKYWEEGQFAGLVMGTFG